MLIADFSNYFHSDLVTHERGELVAVLRLRLNRQHHLSSRTTLNTEQNDSHIRVLRRESSIHIVRRRIVDVKRNLLHSRPPWEESRIILLFLYRAFWIYRNVRRHNCNCLLWFHNWMTSPVQLPSRVEGASAYASESGDTDRHSLPNGYIVPASEKEQTGALHESETPRPNHRVAHKLSALSS